jgi:hypothetical protein
MVRELKGKDAGRYLYQSQGCIWPCSVAQHPRTEFDERNSTEELKRLKKAAENLLHLGH